MEELVNSVKNVNQQSKKSNSANVPLFIALFARDNDSSKTRALARRTRPACYGQFLILISNSSIFCLGTSKFITIPSKEFLTTGFTFLLLDLTTT